MDMGLASKSWYGVKYGRHIPQTREDYTLAMDICTQQSQHVNRDLA